MKPMNAPKNKLLVCGIAAVLLAATLVAAAYLRPAGRVLPTQLGRRTPRTPEALRRADALVAVDAATTIHMNGHSITGNINATANIDIVYE